MSEKLFLGCVSQEPRTGCPAIIGCPLDMTSTYRKGSDKAPQAIRDASESIETYSPFFGRDITDFFFSDSGDLNLSDHGLDAALNKIEARVSEVLSESALPFCIGGEHTITLPIIKALNGIRNDFVVIHADAHSDLRHDYEGSLVNHATVIQRVEEIVGPRRLVQLGIRSGTKQEFSWMRENRTLLQWGAGAEKLLLKRIVDRPVYLTLDLDVLDPSCMPATGNPEPGGWFYDDLERLFTVLSGQNLLGADVVELNPSLDPSEVGTITAARIVRELLLVLRKNI
ncbi:MAG: agmatinase [Desulfomonile tiedjei]|nr:agmatinase [Desulfomonile tiedjei]